ncbi:MAG: prolipoprotein diacylglyceryl transferase family protein [Candidatus Dormibacter sp.]
MSVWFDSVAAAEPYAVRLRLAGRRIGVARQGPRDAFIRDEVIEGIVPDSGPVSVTTRVFDINEGQWNVDAAVVTSQNGAARSRPHTLRAPSAVPVHPAAWSWPRWKLKVAPAGPVKTRLAPLTGFDRMPAVIAGSWTALVALGVVIGFLFQGRLLPREHVDPGRVFLVSLMVVAAGSLGGKLWFIGLRRSLHGVWCDGMCIQGALVGAAVVMIAGLAVLHLPIGAVVDGTTPGLFLGIAVGRVGCFLTGCCAGRLSASRWALWSSDRRVGARRVPTQLLESLSALVIGLAGLAVILHTTTATSGALFVASFAAYTLCRQLLLPLRAEGRKTSRGTTVTAVVAAVVLSASVAVLMIGVR